MPHYNGINTPVFSLRTEDGCGIGEYLDLIPLIDWAASVGFNVIQTLPLNDSGKDASPYNIQSAFALNPLLIKWPGLNDKGLNQLESIDYDAVRDLKKKAVKKASIKSKELHLFVKENPWVEEYAHYHDQDESIVEQYLCSSQMKAVKSHADKKGVKLLGDIPILIAPDSVDVKSRPELFITDLSAGAPPDQYSLEGQNWGFPLYNWHAMKNDQFRWWKERLQIASQYYHMYRIDHIVGFYRIYAYPLKGLPSEGAFYPADEKIWVDHGESILHQLQNATSMLPIGEDLGTIPHEVRTSLQKLNIPGTKVMRWEKEWEKDQSFIPLQNYPKESLTTVSTHDSSPLRLWWQTDKNEAQEFAAWKKWIPTANLSDSMIKQILKESHSTPSRYRINLLLEYLSAIPDLRWDDPQKDRINQPGIIDNKNWTWRMKPTLEKMAQSEELTRMIKSFT